jgi:hypothetical protein
VIDQGVAHAAGVTQQRGPLQQSTVDRIFIAIELAVTPK